MIAVLSNVNCDPVIRKVSAEYPVVASVGYGGVMETLLNPTSTLSREDPELIFILIDAREFFLGENDLRAKTERFFAELKSAMRSGKQYIISDADYYLPVDISYRADGFAARAEEIWNEQLRALCHDNGDVYVFPLSTLVRKAGEKVFYSDKSWNMGSIRYSLTGLRAISEEVLRICRAAGAGPKKVLALDLDNTLWGGLAGEDGLDVSIADSGAGRAYKEFQYGIRQLKESGVILAIVSKNNEEDAWRVIDGHRHMVLHREDFSAYRINWKSKSENLREIAQELNVGLDSVVFVDDSPLERSEVTELLPQVCAPDFPAESELLPAFLEELTNGFFRRMAVTEEDRNKAEQYAARQKIKEMEAQASSFPEFLKSLSIVITRVDPESHMERMAQLVQKTNQFNTAVVRYSQAELEKMASSREWKIFFYDVEDRVAKHGLCALAFVHITDRPVLEEFLMSCRVMGRNIEYGVINEIERELRSEGYDTVEAVFRKGPKNVPVSELYDRAGYRVQSAENEVRLYRKDLNEPDAGEKYYGEVRSES